MKLRVRNFQSIGDATLEIEGLCVVTGPSNRGKSALIRAAQAMLFGLPGDHYVKRGEDWTGGALRLEAQGNQHGPLEITWRKVPSHRRKPNLQPVLKINQIEHTKIGRDHKHLTAPHGVIELETTATRLRPQVAMQHDPIYLVGENETTAAEVFKLLGRIDVVTAAQGLARTDLRAAESKRKTRTEDLAKATTQRDELAGIPPLQAKLDALRTRLTAAETKREELEHLRGSLRELTNLKPTPAPTPPTMTDPTPVTNRRNLLDELARLARVVVPKQPHLGPAPNEELLEKIRELIRLDEDQAELETQRHVAERTLAGSEAMLAEARTILGVCPTCGRPFDGTTDHVPVR